MTEIATLSFMNGVLTADKLPGDSKTGFRLNQNELEVLTASPIQHLNIQHGFDPKCESLPQKFSIRLNPGATLKISESFDGNQPASLFELEIILLENSKLRYEELQLGSLDKNSVIKLERGATLEHVIFSGNNHSHSAKMQLELLGEGASANLAVLFAVKNGDQASHKIALLHSAPHAQSRQLIKGIIQEGGRASFDGAVHVARNAQKTAASQVNKNLLLGPKAFIDTKPTLEIQADDVKCTHGATVGRISDEELFYLQSRAIPRALAQNMLVRGFAKEVILSAQDEVLRSRFEKILNSEFFLEAA